MLVRVRSNVGVWRVDGLDESTATVQDVLNGIAVTRPHVEYEKPLSLDPACANPITDLSATLSSLRIRHGGMLHCRVDASTTVAVGAAAVVSTTATAAATPSTDITNTRRVIDKDGSIRMVAAQGGGHNQDKGFRKGMLPLRDMKMAWTLNEFMALDSQFTFKIQRQEASICSQVSLDSPSVHNFQAYLQQFAFSRSRVGFLYGHFQDTGDGGDDTSKKRALVEFIYEPPQEVDKEAAEGFVLLDDPMEDRVNEIAQMLGMVKVGWIFGHPPRSDKDMVMSAAEIIMTAELQLEAAQGVQETPFVTIKVTQNNSNSTTDDNANSVSVEAFQVSQQCMAMAAEEALLIDEEDPGKIKINPTFTAIQEGKPAEKVDNNFFLTVVPIVQHTSDKLVCQFPRANRDLDPRQPNHDELKRQLSQSGKAGWTFVDLLADFHLLLYLSQFLDVHADFPKICQSIVDRAVPLDDGYKIIITSMAGIDGSY